MKLAKLVFLSSTITLTACSTKLVNIHEPLVPTESQCTPLLPFDIKQRALSMNYEDKLSFIDTADFYRAKITTLCNLIKAHNEAHKL